LVSITKEHTTTYGKAIPKTGMAFFMPKFIGAKIKLEFWRNFVDKNQLRHVIRIVVSRI